MFGTIITTDKNGKIKLDKKFHSLCPELFSVYNDKNLGGPMIQWIVNVYDRKSIYRHLPLDIRKEDVALSIWGKKENKRIKQKKVEDAIELYEYVMYDPLIDQYNAMVNKNKKKIKIYNDMEITEENFRKVNSMETEMQNSTAGLESLKKRIQTEEEEREIMGAGSDTLSFIEEKLLNRKHEK